MAAASPFLASLIGHTEIAEFAADSVNLKREDAEEYRQQVRNLRDKLDRYAADHPEHGLIKTLLSGSLAKGTALKTLNDIDIAFYVKGEKVPSKERELLEWLAQRVREPTESTPGRGFRWRTVATVPSELRWSCWWQGRNGQ